MLKEAHYFHFNHAKNYSGRKETFSFRLKKMMNLEIIWLKINKTSFQNYKEVKLLDLASRINKLLNSSTR